MPATVWGIITLPDGTVTITFLLDDGSPCDITLSQDDAQDLLERLGNVQN